MVRTLEQSTMRKVYLRLLPFAVLSYILAYIDRINVSFAGLTMRGDLDMSAAAFGFAVGKSGAQNGFVLVMVSVDEEREDKPREIRSSGRQPAPKHTLISASLQGPTGLP